MSLNAREVAEILKALEASAFDSLDLEIDGVKLSLRRSGAAPPGALAPRADEGGIPTSGAGVTGASATTSGAFAAVPAAPAPDAASRPAADAPPGTLAVPAPLLGVFYRAPKPGESPYVEPGSRVEEDTIIGIIEVMKLMNTVRAGLRGEVVAIAARNGELVEFGEALLFVRPD